MSAPLTIINPNDRNWTRHRFVLWFGWFGTCVPTHLMVYANGLDDALEECADWLAANEPGHLMPLYGDEHMALIAEVATEHGLTLAQLDEVDEQQRFDLEQDATADCTYTEQGYLTSYEWGISLENPTRAEVKAFIAELESRHYGDGPVVKVA